MQRYRRAEAARKRVVDISYQSQKVDEQMGMLSDQVVSLATEINKVVEATGRLITTIDDISHV